MTNRVIIFEGRDCSDEMDGTPFTMRPNKTRYRDGLVKTKTEKDEELNGSPNDSLVANNSATNSPSRYAPISIIFVLCCMIGIISFSEYLFVYREILNENQNANLNNKYDNFCNELLCHIPNYADKYSNTDADLLSQNHILAYIFGIECNMIWICPINSGNCYENININF